jgi:hypothetical protein
VVGGWNSGQCGLVCVYMAWIGIAPVSMSLVDDGRSQRQNGF